MNRFPGRSDLRKLVMSGQSMNYLPAAPQDVPARVGRIVGLKADYTPAHAGEGWDALMEPNRLAELEAACTTTRSILVMNGGQGDILDQSGRTGQECYEVAAEYAELARGYGYWKVVGVAMPGVTNAFYTAITAQMLEAWTDVQVLTNQDPDGIYDAVADCSSAPLADASNLNYFTFDELHLSANGGAVMGDRIGAVVAAL